MSISTLSNNITRLLKEIADLKHKKSLETKKEMDAKAKILSIQKSITKNTSLTSLNSKMSDIARKERDISSIVSKLADLEKKLADKETSLLKDRQALAKAEADAQKKLDLLEKKRQKEQLDFQHKLKQETTKLSSINRNLDDDPERIEVQYDFFISHASEDKEEFVKPLAETLESMGVRVWYDEFSMKVGDSLTKSIDRGLINSKFGVIVLSKAFMKKQWTNYEFKSLVSREMHHGEKVILPIWHEISKNDVMAFSPHLADKVALNSSTQTIEEIASDLKDVLN